MLSLVKRRIHCCVIHATLCCRLSGRRNGWMTRDGSNESGNIHSGRRSVLRYYILITDVEEDTILCLWSWPTPGLKSLKKKKKKIFCGSVFWAEGTIICASLVVKVPQCGGTKKKWGWGWVVGRWQQQQGEMWRLWKVAWYSCIDLTDTSAVETWTQIPESTGARTLC